MVHNLTYHDQKFVLLACSYPGYDTHFPFIAFLQPAGLPAGIYLQWILAGACGIAFNLQIGFCCFATSQFFIRCTKEVVFVSAGPRFFPTI
jgi:hypothetical protein